MRAAPRCSRRGHGRLQRQPCVTPRPRVPSPRTRARRLLRARVASPLERLLGFPIPKGRPSGRSSRVEAAPIGYQARHRFSPPRVGALALAGDGSLPVLWGRQELERRAPRDTDDGSQRSATEARATTRRTRTGDGCSAPTGGTRGEVRPRALVGTARNSRVQADGGLLVRLASA